MKLKILIWIALIVLILLTQNSALEYFKLNNAAVIVSKASTGETKNNQNRISFVTSNEKSINCHLQWLELSVSSEDQAFSPPNLMVDKLINCSSVNMRMLRYLYPNEHKFAELAVQTYSEDTFPLYWLAESIGKGFTSEKKPILEKILRINPKDGIAWRILGLIYINESNFPAAIQAHINSCNNGDPGSNGCYHAGRLLEQEGRLDQAIYYYRLSRWQPSQDEADRLEAELSSQNP